MSISLIIILIKFEHIIIIFIKFEHIINYNLNKIWAYHHSLNQIWFFVNIFISCQSWPSNWITGGFDHFLLPSWISTRKLYLTDFSLAEPDGFKVMALKLREIYLKYFDADKMRRKSIWNICMQIKWEATLENLNWPRLMDLNL